MVTEREALYLDLMKRSLTNWIYGQEEIGMLSPKKNSIKRILFQFLNNRGLEIVRRLPMNAARRTAGSDRSPVALTMIGLKRLDNIQSCVETILKDNIPGDFIETGVWRGGATIFMRAILAAYNIKDRTVWVADSFEGCPRPDKDRYPHDKEDTLYTSRELAIPLEDVKGNFRRYGLLDRQVRFLKGWFKDTLPKAPIKEIALIRADGDLYESTMDTLTNLYPKLSRGGYIIIDDFGAMASCRKAVEDYRKKHSIHDKIVRVDRTGAYWRKTG